MRGKTILGLALVITIIVGSLVGCAIINKDDNSLDDEVDLVGLSDQLLAGIDVPAYEAVTLDDTNYEFFAFAPYQEGITAVACDALVNINPHSVVIIHDDNGKGDDLALAIFDKADPNKWLCVGSEVVTVANTEHYVVLVMSTQDIANDIVSNFSNISDALDGSEITVHTKDNTIRYN